MKTYVVEQDNNVVEYFKLLHDAKSFVQLNHPNAEILAIQGPYFGEGFHDYRLRWDGDKFYKVGKI